MTEQEAIKFLTGYLDSVVYKEKCVEAHKLAIKALEENQQYRAIGTPEECRSAAETIKSMIERNLTTEIMTEYMKFEDECVKQGFSFNSLLEAREKQTAKKPVPYKPWYGKCPMCSVVFTSNLTNYCGN